MDAEFLGAEADTPVQPVKAGLDVPFFHLRKGSNSLGGRGGSLPGGKAGQVIFRDLLRSCEHHRPLDDV